MLTGWSDVYTTERYDSLDEDIFVLLVSVI